MSTLTPTIESLVSFAPFTLRRVVRWGDCDPAGIVYTPRFLDYVVSGYEGFISHLLGAPLHGAKEVLGVDFPARGVELDFRVPLELESSFDLELRLGCVRTRSFDLHAKAIKIIAGQRGPVAFLARISPITIDPITRQAVSLPASLRTSLLAYSEEHSHIPEAS